MRPTDSRNLRAGTVRQEKLFAGRFMLRARSLQFVRIEHLSSVMKNHAYSNEVAVYADPQGFQLRDKNIRGLANQLDVSKQPSRSAQTLQQQASLGR